MVSLKLTTSDPVDDRATGRPIGLPGRRWPWLPASHVGPQWFAAVMGTGILATCTERLALFIPGLHAAALGLLVLTWSVLAAVAAAFASHAVRHPARFRASIEDLGILPFYGAVAMGLLATGGATLAVAEAHLPATARVLAWVLWSAGTLIGVVSAVAFPVRLIAAGPAERGVPTPVWVLPVVPPMVAAAGGAVLADALPPEGAYTLLLASGCLFMLTLSLSVVMLILAYGHLVRGGPVPLPASPSFWVPVGIAGQSTAAANFFLAPAEVALSSTAQGIMLMLTVAYSTLALSLGTAAAGVALWITVRALRRGMSFGLGWWSFTFPIGTMSLGLSAFGTTLDAAWLHGASAMVCIILSGTVALCLVHSVRLWTTGRTKRSAGVG